MSFAYQYESLPAGKWIRLLRLLPGASNEKIHVELFTIKLENIPSYESISYCWGDPNNQEEIICCEQAMYITESLHSGLKCFRYSEKARILWADAICINQLDEKEKGNQVDMMGDIYNHATGVLIWLGEALEVDAENAFRLLRAINEYIDSQIIESELAINPWRAVANVPLLVNQSLLFQDPSRTKALYDFWRCAWFGRVWVLQEVALASSARVFYGKSSISLSQVIQAAYLLSWRPDIGGDFHVGRWADAFADTLITYTTKKTWIQETRLLRHWQESLARRATPTFNKILSNSSRFEATNSLDHIYAFLGHPAARSKDGSAGLLEADYTISIEDACQQLARNLYERDQRIDFLCTISHFTLGDIEEFPSWLPQVHKKKMAHSLDHQAWNADGSTEIDIPKVVFQNSTLNCLGLWYDSIIARSETFRWDLFASKNPTVVEICWNLQSNAISSADVVNRLRAFIRTLVGGVYTGGIVYLQRDFDSYCRKETSSQFCSSIRLEDLNNDDTSLIDGNWMQFEREAYSSMQGRRFFITERGHFGLGPSFLREGDICCILLGCKMPIVIRSTPTDGHFKVLGPSYIDGLMYGELINAHVEPNSDLSKVTLV